MSGGGAKLEELRWRTAVGEAKPRAKMQDDTAKSPQAISPSPWFVVARSAYTHEPVYASSANASNLRCLCIIVPARILCSFKIESFRSERVCGVHKCNEPRTANFWYNSGDDSRRGESAAVSQEGYQGAGEGTRGELGPSRLPLVRGVFEHQHRRDRRPFHNS